MGSDGNPFDENLRKLLTQAYEVPEYREDFRNELLGKLKDSQRGRVVARARRTGPRAFVLGAGAGLAAAAMAVFLLSPALPMASGPVPEAPAGNEGRLAVAQNEGEDARREVSLRMSRTAPDRAEGVPVVARTEAREAKRGRAQDASGGAVARPVVDVPVESGSRSQPADPRVVKMPEGRLEYRESPAGSWRRMSGKEAFSLKPRTQVRSVANGFEPVGIWIDEQSKMVMKPGGVVTRTEDGFQLENGSVLLDLGENSKGLRVLLREYEMRLAPGSEVYCKVKNGTEFAADGAPVPTVIVLKGQAEIVRPHAAASRLMAGRIYDLYQTPTRAFPSRPLSPLRRQQVKPDRGWWPEPEVGRVLTVGQRDGSAEANETSSEK